jgi:biotin carboxyl carrier protein
MDLEQLKQILDLVRAHELSEFEVEQDGLKLKIRRNAAGVPVVTMPELAATAPVAASGPVMSAAAAPAAAAPPFVDIGGQVKKGQVLCIIEAMKLMNEIDSEYDGEIVNVYVESGQPVQYGERLFAIRTR